MTGEYRPDRSRFIAPSLDDIEALAAEAYAQLPDAFRDLCGDIIVRVSDFPTEEVLKDLNAETPFDLLGLFHGVGMVADGGTPRTGQMPNMIWLYRRPILDYWAEHEDTLGDIVAHVLIHELGHHFGLSDEDMEQIEAEASA
ncbi:metallopeptidase family protein [Rhodoligotrophos appendicifer]|uniref:metallopeptidase family protein n=1 Tax=Rhodoligotrophos appendicifer TaxID=987056 RepID=UPI001185224F|nr:metallopeptidase family protein [Rhodoligotrophos appendicifer]